MSYNINNIDFEKKTITNQINDTMCLVFLKLLKDMGYENITYNYLNDEIILMLKSGKEASIYILYEPRHKKSKKTSMIVRLSVTYGDFKKLISKEWKYNTHSDKKKAHKSFKKFAQKHIMTTDEMNIKDIIE